MMHVEFSFPQPDESKLKKEHPANVIRLPIQADLLYSQNDSILGPWQSEIITKGHFNYLEWKSVRFGYGTIDIPDSLVEKNVQILYDELWSLLGDRYAYRIWHFVENINDISNDVEVYRRFCTGRAYSYEHRYGKHSEKTMCAASAVGCLKGGLTLYFIGGMLKPQHYENPLQTPAYHYPRRFGPNSPSFSRATRVKMEDKESIFVSGTASIRGCENVAVGDLTQQTQTTLENLRALSAEMALPGTFKVQDRFSRMFVVYIRKPEHWNQVHLMLDGNLYDENDRVYIVQSNICRSELDIEIELTLIER